MISNNYLTISLARGPFKYENISRLERKVPCFDMNKQRFYGNNLFKQSLKATQLTLADSDVHLVQDLPHLSF